MDAQAREHTAHALRDRSVVAAVALVSALALLWLSAPSAAARDGAELSAAAASLGVAHPTGFVLDVLLWRCAMCLPIGDAAFRANALTALCGALSAALVAHLALAWLSSVAPEHRVERRALAALASAALVASPTILRAFTAVEVYASALGASLALVAVVHHARAPVAFRALALGAGLSFVAHTTVRAALVAALVALVAHRPEARRIRGRVFVSCVALGLAAAALALYLPVAARREPWADWGGPIDARGLWAHLSASRIREAFSSQMGLGAKGGLAAALAVLRADLGSVTLIAALVGAVIALRDRSTLALSIVLCALFDLAYTTFINPMGTRDRQTLFLAEAALLLLSARALFSLLLSASSPRARGALTALVALVALVATASRADLSYAGAREAWTAVEVYGGPGAIGAAPPRAVILCESDELCGGSLYARLCEGERPDVVVMPRQHLWDRTTWRRLRVALGRAAPDRSQPRTADEALRVRRLRAVLNVFGPRVRWEQGDRADERLAAISLAPSESPALATPVLAPSSAPTDPIEALPDVSRWIAARESDGVLSRRIAATLFFSAGMRAAPRSLSSAAAFWQQSLARDPDHTASLTNLAVARADAGRVREAIALTERALVVDPTRAVAWQNLVRFCSSAGDAACAADARSRARAHGVNPDPPPRVDSRGPRSP